MASTTLKYNNKIIQLWLFNFVLFFSACTSSGFSVYSQSIHAESIKTELVESRNYSYSAKLFDLQRNIHKTTSTHFLLGLSSYRYSWTLLNFKQSIAIKYKSICKKYFSYKYRCIKPIAKVHFLPHKDESLSFSVI